MISTCTALKWNLTFQLRKINLDLAESYEFSEDGMQLTFHLHDGVKWHDGEPFTSADVKWTYDTAIAEKWSKADNLSNIDSIESVSYTHLRHQPPGSSR